MPTTEGNTFAATAVAGEVTPSTTMLTCSGFCVCEAVIPVSAASVAAGASVAAIKVFAVFCLSSTSSLYPARQIRPLSRLHTRQIAITAGTLTPFRVRFALSLPEERAVGAGAAGAAVLPVV